MTLDDIKRRLDDIKASAGDYEIAHGLEDDMLWEFVEYVVKVGNPELQKMARLIRTSRDIEFMRYCA